jgi:hypothetical protein
MYRGICDEQRRLAADSIQSALKSPPLLLGHIQPANISIAPDQGTIDAVIAVLKGARGLCDECCWKFASDKIGLIVLQLEKYSCDWSSLEADLRNAVDVLMNQMWDVKLVYVDAEYYGHVNNDAVLGEDIKKAFPSATFDLREAGNCIAVDSGTAAVFHLMRAVEWGVRALCVDLGVLDVPRRNATIPIEFAEWDKILDQLYPAVQKKVDALAPGVAKQDTQEFYFTILHDIRGFKDAFRNHVMHTRKVYKQKEAVSVLAFVGKFFELLSTKIKE